jgi:hypothetical protein
MKNLPAFIIATLLDVFMVGLGMGVPVCSVFLGFPIGWCLAKRGVARAGDRKELLNRVLWGAVLTSLTTFILMAGIWGTAMIPRWVRGEFANFGNPLILFSPKASFIGWFFLMVFISPGLKFLATLGAAFITLWAFSDFDSERRWVKQSKD